ncbi:hypothetical protein [Catenisphaera adipataccumulans]|uniref:Uncharacterized protein n=1 Tax=Catenisphaera adipataccumulans TaxID=700500 RepID=A0A7W8FV06_9FIRM|nr:hypothetical protein [Catenisphaera adipataccumulans]MBB5182648.1 hypothetical protein [Catenisphaera adipataccumulans]
MHRTPEEIYQNLLDAGYTKATAERFMTYVNSGDLESQLRDLAMKRTKILEKLHQENRHLECLDYLSYELEKQERRTL